MFEYSGMFYLPSALNFVRDRQLEYGYEDSQSKIVGLAIGGVAR